MAQKNNAIVIWRILFTYVIMFYHFDNKYLLTEGFHGDIGWYIGVEFFFIVSGFLLYSKLDSRKETYKNGLSYLFSRFKKIYPYYFFAYILSFICLWIYQQMSFSDAKWSFRTHIYEMLALQGTGLDMGWSFINNTGWFISVLFISEFLLYHALVKWKETTEDFIIPIVMIVCFSFLYRNMHGIGAAPQTTGFYENWGLMRGLLDMGMGVCAARLCQYITQKSIKTNILKITGCFLIIAVLAMSFVWGNTELDFLYLILLTFGVAFSFIESTNSLFANSIIQKWSSLTLSMYLIHDMFRTSLFPLFFGYPNDLSVRFGLCVLYMFAVTVFAIVFNACIGKITSKI